MPRRPSIARARSAMPSARPDETIVEVFSPRAPGKPERGCLISVRETEVPGARGQRLVIEAYSGDADVYVRINGRDYRVPR